MKKKYSFLLFLTLLLFFFHKPLFFLQPYYGIDLFEHVSAKLWMAQELKQGNLPLWNPYHHSGMPTAADDFTWGVYYPGMLIHILWPGFGFTLEALVHLMIAFYFIRKLILSLQGTEQAACFAGVTFLFGAPSLTVLYGGDTNILYATCWLPAVFYFTYRHATEGGKSIAPGMILALQILGGHPEIVFFSFLFSFAFALVLAPRRRSRILIPYFIAVGISAIHLLPVAEVFASNSMRNEYWRSGSTADQSFPVSFSFSLLTHSLFGRESSGTYWGPPSEYLLDKYIGILPWVLTLFAFGTWKKQLRASRFFLVAICISLWIAFDRESGFSQLAGWIPIVRNFSVPANLMIFVAFFASVVAALQWEQIGNKKMLIPIFLLACAALAGYFAVRWNLFSFPDTFYRIVPETRYAVAFRATLITLIVLAAIAVSMRFSARGALLIGLQILCLAYSGSHWIQSTGLDTYVSAEKWSLLSRERDFYRVFEHLSLPFVDKPAAKLPYAQGSADGMFFHIFQLQGGTTTLALKRYHEFKAFVNTNDFPVADRHFHLTGFESPLLKYANVGYLISAVPIESSGCELIGKTIFYCYRFRDAAPRARIFSQYQVEPDSRKLLLKMSRQYGLYLEQQLPVAASIPGQEGKVEILSYKSDEIRFHTSAPERAYLSVSEIYFPGWRVTIDDAPGEIYRANYTFRAVPIPKGEHLIRMWYRPASWIAGCILSLSTILLMIAFRNRI